MILSNYANALTGAQKDNYTLSPDSSHLTINTITITPKPVTPSVTGPITKVYDGNANVTLAYTLDTGIFLRTVTLSTDAATFSQSGAGTGLGSPGRPRCRTALTTRATTACPCPR